MRVLREGVIGGNACRSALLLGVAVGDALGVPVEFRARGTFHVTDMQGYGTHNQPPGTWSDDTSLTLALSYSLAHGYNLYDMAHNFVRWHDEAAFTAHGEVFDIGGATAKAIARLKAGVAPELAGGTEERDNGNGSLMRIAPLVFYVGGKPQEERFRITKAVSSLTHAHEWSVAACYIYIEMLYKLLIGMDKDAAYAELREYFQRSVPFISKKTLKKFDRILKADVSALPESEIQSSGFVVDTFEAALWCFLTTPNYKEAVLKAVNLGEDTDTTAAVTGALAGLAYGVESIPPAWLELVAGYDDILHIAAAMP